MVCCSSEYSGVSYERYGIVHSTGEVKMNDFDEKFKIKERTEVLFLWLFVKFKGFWCLKDWSSFFKN